MADEREQVTAGGNEEESEDVEGHMKTVGQKTVGRADEDEDDVEGHMKTIGQKTVG